MLRAAWEAALCVGEIKLLDPNSLIALPGFPSAQDRVDRRIRTARVAAFHGAMLELLLTNNNSTRVGWQVDDPRCQTRRSGKRAVTVVYGWSDRACGGGS